LQLTLDLTLSKPPLPKQSVARSASYRHPLKNFHKLAVADGAIKKEDDMGVLRKACSKLGLSQAGWRFLNRYGERAYAAVLANIEGSEGVFESAVFYVNWQSRAGLKVPLADELGKRFIFCLGDIYELVPEIDPRITKAANDYWHKLADPAERLNFAADEWVRVLNWLLEEKPVFDRNQWRAGWGAIRRNYQKWQQLNPEPNAWHSLLPAFEQGDFCIRPLISSHDLAREAYQMQHCVQDYVEPCLSGNYRLFSISRKSTGQPMATAGMGKEGDYWKIDQIKGRFNQTPDTRAARLGQVIQRKYMHEEELIIERKIQERKKSVLQMREKQKAYLKKSHTIPEEYRAAFSPEELNYLERHAAWLSALVSGELLPIAFEQVRFIAVSNGVLRPNTETERVWVKYRRMCDGSNVG